MFTLLEFECLGACDRAPVVMVNNEHWHEKATPESCAKLVDDIKAAASRPVGVSSASGTVTRPTIDRLPSTEPGSADAWHVGIDSGSDSERRRSRRE